MSDNIDLRTPEMKVNDCLERIEALEKKFELVDEAYIEYSDEKAFFSMHDKEIVKIKEQIAELKEEVRVLGNVEDGQWAEMFTIKEILRELIAIYEQENLVETGLLDRLSGGTDSKTEKKEVGERMCPKCWELYKNHDINHHGNFICKVSGGELSASRVEDIISFTGEKPSNNTDSNLPEPKFGDDCGGCPIIKAKTELMKLCSLCGSPIGDVDVCPICTGRKTEPENTHALDAMLHAVAPIPLPEVRKLIDDSNNNLIEEFLEDWDIAASYQYGDCDELNEIREKWQGRVK